jgi:D-3-phosphoglycerate dehydrogenase
VGVDNIDLKTAERLGITVTRTVSANADAVADTAFGLMLAVAKRIPYIDAACRRGLWLEPETYEVNNKTLGLIGMGDIGRRVAKRAKGFEMRVLAYDQFQDNQFAQQWKIQYTDLKKILSSADFISVHLPITPETRNLIGANEIGLMKKTAIVINTARGGIIDEEALIEALRTKRIFGAGLDVFVKEPIILDHWKDLDNVVLSSHCAADTVEATNRMSEMAAKNIVNYFLE